MVNILYENIVCDAKAVIAHKLSDKVYCVFLKMKANCSWKAIIIGSEQNVLAK